MIIMNQSLSVSYPDEYDPLLSDIAEHIAQVVPDVNGYLPPQHTIMILAILALAGNYFENVALSMVGTEES